MNPVSEALVAVLIVVGALFVLLGAIGLARLPDFLTRLHGPTKATTLGVGTILLASAIFFSQTAETGLSLHELAILFFLFITAPISAHLLAKAALHRRPPAGEIHPAAGPELAPESSTQDAKTRGKDTGGADTVGPPAPGRCSGGAGAEL
ncbi:Na+/H+ antiporter subunit G [Accumulibacter sp.]|uniref:Na+/H+ antiporter subunit G n=1 Tax=Accumulibacter sp. TaxID=2053492 RepID=UPI0025CF9964|nr:Na+/H+ antiporter subunit G [Accumulibacter sp.]MCM8596873.1 Na+/H+ antiporter subunit G [Accumulibacter sp.]MCM8624593.1 Na+/H+ antiporter subunit G [Accumulibacter sp.]MDS4051021.1 Na+/H+ antiporter subunit G [Accumulibacter sp.]